MILEELDDGQGPVGCAVLHASEARQTSGKQASGNAVAFIEIRLRLR